MVHIYLFRSSYANSAVISVPLLSFASITKSDSQIPAIILFLAGNVCFRNLI